MTFFIVNQILNGPYKFVEWKNNERITLERFDKYFDGKPSFDKYIFDINPSQATALNTAIHGKKAQNILEAL